MSCKLGAGCYLSSVVRTLTVPHVVLTECTYEPRYEVPKHEHEWLHFGFLLRGGFTEQAHFGEQECRPNALIFHPVGDVHADRFGPKGGRCFNLELDPHWDSVKQWSSHAEAWTEPSSAGGVAMQLYREFKSPDSVTPLAMHGLVLLLTAALVRDSARPEARMPRWLTRVEEKLRSDIAGEHHLASLALEAGVHEVHLCREFRRHLGCTISEYVRKRRIELACRRLRVKSVKLGELAHDLGFGDQAHFCRSFRREMGMSPTQYRQVLRG